MARSGAAFGGRVGRTVADSTPWWPARPAPAKDAPNVVVIVFDDVGFSDLGCYGSAIATPNADRLAASGLRYNNFHTTAICSSSRACLMTGRNHHAVGMGAVANWDTGFPGYRGHVARSAGMMSEMLQSAGYASFAAGKWHLTPLDETTAAGPYDQWPLARGFDRFHGVFVGGSEWAPEYLIHDNHRQETPRRPGYHFSEDIVDRTIGFMRDHVSIWPEKPFFSYLCFHACHSPLHAPGEFIERYRGRFDHGWDEERARRFARQKELGVIPHDAELAPRNPGVRPWEILSADERRVACRLQECYAAMLEHADAQIGRLIDWLEKAGKRENTLLMLVSDNGGTMEGRDMGSPNWHRQQNRLDDLSAAEVLRSIDDVGGPRSYPVYPAGWGQVSNTPLKRYKAQTHGGGVRDPLIVSWPARIKEGGIRGQFHHLIDILPTVVEATGVQPPRAIKGVEQQPIDGVSMMYSFADPHRPTRKDIQYFEMLGHRGIWKDGWKAVCHHERGTDFDADRWELYHLDSDFSECRDLANQHPAKLRELVDLWWSEAQKHDVLPLDDRGLERYNVPKPRPITSRDRFVYYPGVYVPTEGMPDFRNRDYRITAEVLIPPEGAEGVLLGVGDATIGFALFMQDGRLVHDYNCAGEHSVLRSERTLAPGLARLRLEIAFGDRDSAKASLYLDDTAIGSGAIPRMLRASLHSVGLAVGWNAGYAVSDAYEAPFPFTGEIERVVVELGRRAP